jgi:molecular chaperone DnaJ
MATQPRDYYDVLGVSKTASAEDLKRAYRNLAKKYHPDVNSAADAADKFKEIQIAYDTLSDDAKRRQYDRFGPEGVSGAGAGFPEGFNAAGGLGDLFDLFFGQTAAPRGGRDVARGDDLREDLELTLEEVASGVEKTIRYQRMETCRTCDGSGARPGTTSDTCPQCGGQGQVRFSQHTPLGTFSTAQICNRCRGAGKVILTPCTTCSGSGRTRNQRERSVKIPAGADNGLRLRLVGEGDSGERGGPSGDLYLMIYVRDHDTFERRGNDILCELPLSMARAALGGTVQVPILNGTEELKIHEGTQPGQVYTLKGKGLPELNGRTRGDEHVVIKVQVPTRLTAEQRELLKQFAATLGEKAHEGADGSNILGRIFGKH